MAIGPFSSAMTFQAQPTVKAQPAESANKEVPVDGQPVNVDAVTAAVSQAGEGQSDGRENGGGQQQQQQQPQSASSEQLKKAVAEVNKKFGNGNVEAVFGIHEKTNRITIKIMDKETKEVVKEYPPEKTLDMIAKVWEMAGILVDEKL